MAIRLTGITWNHSRGFLPVAATAQRYMELHPEVEIRWESRSLKEFGDAPIDRLAETYDMIILDHPWMGFADEHRVLLPLEDYIEKAYLEDQSVHSVGRSHESYCYRGHQYATVVDAACPVASYSPRKLEAFGGRLPETWEQVMELAGQGGVVCAGNGTSILMQFYMLCATKTAGTGDMFRDGHIAPAEIMEESLEEIKSLFDCLPKEVFRLNPIGVCDLLAGREGTAAYSPFDFGYSNYSRSGYGEERILAADAATYRGKLLKTVLGGAGFAVSAGTAHREQAIDYLKYTSCGRIQSTLYVQNGGQPGHREAWLNEEANRITGNFFANTLRTLDNAYLRPRYDGYLDFQEKAGPLIRSWIMEKGDRKELIEKLELLYRQSGKDSKVE